MPDLQDDLSSPSAYREPSWRIVLVFLLLVVGLQAIGGPLVRLSEWKLRGDPAGGSLPVLEALAWHDGRFDLATTGPAPLHSRPTDTAYRDGRVYNVFPPLLSFLSYAALSAQAWQGQAFSESAAIYSPWYVAVVMLPVLLVGFWAFRQVTGRSEWAAVLTGYWILGTPILIMLVASRTGLANYTNHALSNVGLLLIAGDMLGRRRLWPACLGLLIAVWTRQLTVFYSVAMVLIVWRVSLHRKRDLALIGLVVFVALGTLGMLNYLKFGHPLDSGYASIYAGRDGIIAQRAVEHGHTFDVRFVARNFWWMNLALPELSIQEPQLQLRLLGDGDGASFWLGSPLLLLVFWDARRWWRDGVRRSLMIASFLVIPVLLCYHTTGAAQAGFFRFSLDFMPIWLMVLAPYTAGGRRAWFALACLGWSVLYFQLICLNYS